MRRPLCLLSLAFVAAVMLVLSFFPPPSNTYEKLEGEVLWVEGMVYRKEQKDDTVYVYLRQLVLEERADDAAGNTAANNIVENDLTNLMNLNQQVNQKEVSNTNHNDYISQKEIKKEISKEVKGEIQEKQLKNEHSGHDIPEGIICTLPVSQEPKSGSRIRVYGKLLQYPKATNKGAFDQRKYWKIQRIDMQMPEAELQATSAGYDWWGEILYQYKQSCEKKYEMVLEEKEASVLKAMLFGNKKELDMDIKSLFQRNGIAHILAISGLHISMIGMGLYRLLRKVHVPITPAAVIAVLLMSQYGIMTGRSSSACRAIIMFMLQLLAQSVRRSYDMLTAMALAAVCIVIEQPLYVYDSGFQLSFGAILGIGIVYPMLRYLIKIENGFEQGRRRFYIGMKKVVNTMTASVAITVTTMPILLFSYYELPIYAILLNLIVIPLMTIVMFFGMAIIPTSSIQIMAGKLTAFPCVILLAFYEQLCGFMEQLPGAIQIIGKPETIRIVLFYTGLCVVCIFHEKVGRYLAVLCLVITANILTNSVKDNLRITMLDVGQGDCFCIENPRGVAYLIDAGSSSKSEVGKYQVIPYLKAQGIRELQAIFVTHSDSDHISAVQELLGQLSYGNAIRIKRLVLPGISAAYQDAAYKELAETAENNHIRISYLNTEDVWKDEKLVFTCIHPYKGFQPENVNAYSMVLWMSYGKYDMLFTGDVEKNGEKALIERVEVQKEKVSKLAVPKVEVLKIAHHGSKNTTSEALLTTCSPQVGFISCGLHNRYGHPNKELLQRLEKYKIPYLETDKEGAVSITTDGESYRISTYLTKQKFMGVCR